MDQPPGVLAFGPFKLDTLRRTLSRDGVPVPLTSRLFETLLYMLQHPNRLVARDELERAVWRDRAVEDGNLQKAVSSLRKALQTGPPGESYISTIAGRGFRFTEAVIYQAYDAPSPAAKPGLPPVAPPLWQKKTSSRALMAALLIAVVIAVFNLRLRPVTSIGFSPPAHSIGVLPFINLGGDGKADYFSDGLADELTNTLSRVSGLHVAARTSAFTFEGTKATIPEIGRRLNVAAILGGTVRRDGQRVHISVQLVDTQMGFQFWARSFDRDRVSDDVLNIQTDIAQSVADSLDIKLMQAGVARLIVGATHDARAFDAYLRGMTNSRAFGESNIKQAILDFSEAIRLDPADAQAFAGRAAAHNYMVTRGYEPDLSGDKREAVAAAADADHAISLAPMLAEAHRVKSVILFTGLAFKSATTELAIASDIAPDDPRVEATRGMIESQFGHDMVAIAAARHAVAMDPLNPEAYQQLGEVLYRAHHFGDAMQAFGHATAVDHHPSRLNLTWIASVYLAQGNPAAAEHICADGNGWSDDICLAIAYNALGEQAKAQTKFENLHKMLGEYGAYVYAEIYAQWGDHKEALRWLEIACALNKSSVVDMKVSPLLDPIRGDVEFAGVERRLEFPP